MFSWAAVPYSQNPCQAASADPQMRLQHTRPVLSISTVSDVLSVERGYHETKADS